jgi:hypothetical protein
LCSPRSYNLAIGVGRFQWNPKPLWGAETVIKQKTKNLKPYRGREKNKKRKTKNNEKQKTLKKSGKKIGNQKNKFFEVVHLFRPPRQEFDFLWNFSKKQMGLAVFSRRKTSQFLQ